MEAIERRKLLAVRILAQLARLKFLKEVSIQTEAITALVGFTVSEKSLAVRQEAANGFALIAGNFA